MAPFYLPSWFSFALAVSVAALAKNQKQCASENVLLSTKLQLQKSIRKVVDSEVLMYEDDSEDMRQPSDGAELFPEPADDAKEAGEPIRADKVSNMVDAKEDDDMEAVISKARIGVAKEKTAGMIDALNANAGPEFLAIESATTSDAEAADLVPSLGAEPDASAYVAEVVAAAEGAQPAFALRQDVRGGASRTLAELFAREADAVLQRRADNERAASRQEELARSLRQNASALKASASSAVEEAAVHAAKQVLQEAAGRIQDMELAAQRAEDEAMAAREKASNAMDRIRKATSGGSGR